MVRHMIEKGTNINGRCCYEDDGDYDKYHQYYEDADGDFDFEKYEKGTWETPLHLACRYGSTEILQYLLFKGANVNAKNAAGNTPLSVAKTSEIKSILLEAMGVPRSVPAWEDATAKRWDAVKQCLDKNQSLITDTNDDGDTLLHHAAHHNTNVEFLKYLVSLGANINAKNRLGNTPLHKAAWHNSNVEVVTYLVSLGADVNLSNIKGKTPLDLARNNKNAEVVKYLEGKTMANWCYYNEQNEKISVTASELKGLAMTRKITPETFVEAPSGRTGLAKDVKGLKFE